MHLNIKTDVTPKNDENPLGISHWRAMSKNKLGFMEVPINSLGSAQSERIRQHLKKLDTQDRYLRFGYPATDEQIDHYVSGLDYERDDIYGIFNSDMELIAMAHLALPREGEKSEQAEFGVSVLGEYRGKGYGGRLFERASIHAVNNSIKTIYIHALSENAPMLNIASKHGAVLQREGSETEAYVALGEPSIDTHLVELISEQYAKTNYDIKKQVKSFWDFIKNVHDIREGVKLARHKSSS